MCSYVQMKKMLSANAEAPYNIECIMEDVDVKVCSVFYKLPAQDPSMVSYDGCCREVQCVH
jgi:hypothetical protein